MATGEIMVSKIPQGRYKIYYLRPRDRVRQIKSAQSRLQRVGRGQEFNIFYLKGAVLSDNGTLSSYAEPSAADDSVFKNLKDCNSRSKLFDRANASDLDSSIPLSINTDKVLSQQPSGTVPLHLVMQITQPSN